MNSKRFVSPWNMQLTVAKRCVKIALKYISVLVSLRLCSLQPDLVQLPHYLATLDESSDLLFNF